MHGNREFAMDTIRDWPAAERPRERLLAHGPAVLSDAELLALFLRTGTSGKNAVDFARELLQLSLIHISEPTRLGMLSRMPSSA